MLWAYSVQTQHEYVQAGGGERVLRGAGCCSGGAGEGNGRTDKPRRRLDRTRRVDGPTAISHGNRTCPVSNNLSTVCGHASIASVHTVRIQKMKTFFDDLALNTVSPRARESTDNRYLYTSRRPVVVLSDGRPHHFLLPP